MGRIADFFSGADNSAVSQTPDFSHYNRASVGMDTDGSPYYVPDTYNPTQGYLPPSRNRVDPVTIDTALTIPAVYRAFDILSTAVSQLELKVVRNNVRIDTPAIIEQPDSNQSLSQFLKRTVIGLAADGNAFWLLYRDDKNQVFNIEVLNPRLVQIQYNQKSGEKYYQYGNQKFNKTQIAHLRKLEIPGYDRGLGPIQACRGALKGSLDLTNYKDNWFSDSGVPTGVLTSDQQLDRQQAQEVKQRWNESQETRGVAVLGKGLEYHATILNPC
jgi:HK97 family phage portal protein